MIRVSHRRNRHATQTSSTTIPKLSSRALFRSLARPRTLAPRPINRALRSFARRSAELAIGSEIRSAVTMNLDDDLDVHRALEEGDAALVRLMEEIKEAVVETSERYRECLRKQIEVTRVASQVGPLAEAWDELTRYRATGGDLLKEINDNLAIFNTIGEMAREESLVEHVRGTTDHLDSVGRKYKELEQIVAREVEENKKLEMELLKINCDSILQELNDDVKT